MSLFRRLIALLVPLATVVLALAACQGHDSRWTGNPAEPLPRSLADAPSASPCFAPGQLEHHFQKHGLAMGFANQADYLRAAQALVRGGPDVETLRRDGGDTLFYRASTDEFAVLSDRNVIRTYFKPDDGPAYWERQKDR